MRTLLLLLLVGLINITTSSAQNYINITPGYGYGLRLWSEDSYKIHMGNDTEYHYGPVTDYSIKTNMSNDPGRGWTWGISGAVPVAALNNLGHMQVAGTFTTKGLTVYRNNTTDKAKIDFGAYSYLESRNVNADNISGNNYGTAILRNAYVHDQASNTFYNPNGYLQSQKMEMRAGNWYFDYRPGQNGAIATWPESEWINRMFIEGNTGNVGIGTTSPNTKVEIASQNTDLSILKLRNTAWACNQRTAIEFWNGVNKNFATSRITSQMDGCGANGEALLFETQTAGATSPSTKLIIKNDGNVGIGTSNPNQKLTVNGTIYGKEVKVDLNVPGPDYVFEENYNLPSLTEIENYIKQNKHLPEVPSAEEMEANGINVSEMNMLLLKKVEELTLYLIELKKRDEVQQVKIDKQEKEIQELKENKK